jgi:hypothetical protein
MIALKNGKNTVSVGGRFSLLGGATAVETKAVKAVCPSGGGLVIVVSLAAPAESIDFRVVCNG